jgi:phage shock protein C
MKKYYRSSLDSKIFGVCSGLAHYTGIDVIIWRLVFLAMIFTPFPIIIFYIILTLITDLVEIHP